MVWRTRPSFGTPVVDGIKHRPNVETLSGTKQLYVSSPRMQSLDPGGAGRNVDFPPEADSEGDVWYISNKADGAESLSLRNDAAGAIATVAQNEQAIVWCDGAEWFAIVA